MDYNVYVKPSLSIVASTNTMVLNLNPSSKPFDTANLNVTVGTNNLYGYKLFMTTDNDTTYLDRDTSSDGVSANIPTLAVSSATQSSSDLINHWGYRVNNDVGGDSNIIDTTGTNFFPYTPTPTQPLISSATTASNERTASLTFGTKIDFNQPSGTYDLLLKFKAIPNVTTYYMQDIASDPTLASTVCTEEPTVVLDKRDEQSYTIRRIGGDCWMVENLKFVGTTMDSTTTNISPEYTPANPYVATYYDLVTDGTSECYTLSTPSGDGYTYNCKHDGEVSSPRSPISSTMPSGTTTHTVWYNYAAATAGTITGPSNTDPQVYDICPSGWRLPNKTEAEIIGNGTLDNADSFSPTLGGVYSNGRIYGADTQAVWWTSTVSDHTYGRYYLIASNSGMITVSKASDSRGIGNYVRCIMRDTSTTLADISTMQEMTSDIVRNTPDDAPEKTLRDVRDNQDYTVRKINGNIWMTKNLRIAGTVPSQGSNFTGNNIVLNSTSAFNSSWTTPQYKIDTGPDQAWYNFCAASAMANGACQQWNEYTSTQDICPANWRLPTRAEAAGMYSYTSDFSVIRVGWYEGTLKTYQTRYWTSDAAPGDTNGGTQYDLRTTSADLFGGQTWRYSGNCIRCIAK